MIISNIDCVTHPAVSLGRTSRNAARIAAYQACVYDLLGERDVERLRDIPHHIHINRLEHSLRVSYIGYRICRAFGRDGRDAARAGLLHDLYFYRASGRRHCAEHPHTALRNAARISPLNAVEQDAILRHMWPVAGAPPRYFESAAVCLADKLATWYELYIQAVRWLIRPRLKSR